MSNWIGNVELGVTIDKKNVTNELLSVFKNCQQESDKHNITYKIAGDKSSVEAMLKEIRGLTPELLTNIKLNFDKSDFDKEMNVLRNASSKTASQIGEEFKSSIQSSMKGFSISELLDGKKINKDNLLNVRDISKLKDSLQVLRSQTNSFDLGKVTSVNEIQDQVIALNKMKVILESLNKYSDQQAIKIDGNTINIAEALQQNTSQIDSIMSNIGSVIKTNAAQWATTLETTFNSEMNGIINLFNNLQDIINGVFGGSGGSSSYGSGISKEFENLRVQIEQTTKEIETLETKLLELQKNNKPQIAPENIINDAKRAVVNYAAKNDAYFNRGNEDKINEFKQKVNEYMSLGGKLEDIENNFTQKFIKKFNIEQILPEVPQNISQEITKITNELELLRSKREELIEQQQALPTSTESTTGSTSGAGTGTSTSGGTGSGTGTSTTAVVSPKISATFKEELQSQIDTLGTVSASVSGKLSETFLTEVQSSADALGNVNVGVNFKQKDGEQKQDIPVNVTTTPKLSDTFKGDLQQLIDGTGKYDVSIGTNENNENNSVSLKAKVENGEEFKNELKQIVEGENGLNVKVNPIVDKDYKLEINNVTLKDVKVEGNINGGNLKPYTVDTSEVKDKKKETDEMSKLSEKTREALERLDEYYKKDNSRASDAGRYGIKHDIKSYMNTIKSDKNISANIISTSEEKYNKIMSDMEAGMQRAQELADFTFELFSDAASKNDDIKINNLNEKKNLLEKVKYKALSDKDASYITNDLIKNFVQDSLKIDKNSLSRFVKSAAHNPSSYDKIYELIASSMVPDKDGLYEQVRKYISSSKINISQGVVKEFGDNWSKVQSTIGVNNLSKDGGTEITILFDEMNKQLGTTFDSTKNVQDAFRELFEFLSEKPDLVSDNLNRLKQDGTTKEIKNFLDNAIAEKATPAHANGLAFSPSEIEALKEGKYVGEELVDVEKKVVEQEKEISTHALKAGESIKQKHQEVAKSSTESASVQKRSLLEVVKEIQRIEAEQEKLMQLNDSLSSSNGISQFVAQKKTQAQEYTNIQELIAKIQSKMSESTGKYASTEDITKHFAGIVAYVERLKELMGSAFSYDVLGQDGEETFNRMKTVVDQASNGMGNINQEIRSFNQQLIALKSEKSSLEQTATSAEKLEVKLFDVVKNVEALKAHGKNDDLINVNSKSFKEFFDLWMQYKNSGGTRKISEFTDEEKVIKAVEKSYNSLITKEKQLRDERMASASRLKLSFELAYKDIDMNQFSSIFEQIKSGTLTSEQATARLEAAIKALRAEASKPVENPVLASTASTQTQEKTETEKAVKVDSKAEINVIPKVEDPASFANIVTEQLKGQSAVIDIKPNIVWENKEISKVENTENSNDIKFFNQMIGYMKEYIQLQETIKKGNKFIKQGVFVDTHDLRDSIPTQASVKRKLNEYLTTKENGYSEKAIIKAKEELASYVSALNDVDKAQKIFGRNNKELFAEIQTMIENSKVSLEAYQTSQAKYSGILNNAGIISDKANLTFGQRSQFESILKTGNIEESIKFLQEHLGLKIPAAAQQAKTAIEGIGEQTQQEGQEIKSVNIQIPLEANIESLNTSIQSKKDQILPVDINITVNKEAINNLNTLDTELNKIVEKISKVIEKPLSVKVDYSSIKSLYEVGDDGTSSIDKLKASIDGLQTGVLSDLKSAFQGFTINKDLANRIKEVAESLNVLKTTLSNIDPNSIGFLNVIKDLSNQANGLKDLATVIRASKEEIKKAKDEIKQNDNPSTKKTKEEIDKIRNDFISAANNSKFAFDMSSLKVDNNGFVTFTTIIEKVGEEAVTTKYKIEDLYAIINNGSLNKDSLNSMVQGVATAQKQDGKQLFKSIVDAEKELNSLQVKQTRVPNENSEEYKVLAQQIDEVTIKYEKLWNEFWNNPKNMDFISAEDLQRLRELGYTFEQVKAKVNDKNSLKNKTLDESLEKHSSEINNIIKQYEKLGYTSDEIAKKLEVLKELDSNRKDVSDSDVSERTEREIAYQKELNKLKEETANIKSGALENDSSSVVNSLSQTKQLMEQAFNPNIEGFQSVFDRAQKEVDELNDKLSQGKISNTQYTDSISDIITKLNQTVAVTTPGYENIDEAQQAMKAYASTLNNGNVKIGNFINKGKTLIASFEKEKGVIEEVAITWDQYSGQISMASNRTKQMLSVWANFTNGLKARFKSLIQYLSIFVSYYRILGMIKNGINTIKELNTALTEMRKVSDESVSSLKRYQNDSFNVAKAVGTTAKQIQDSTADWMRLGESIEEAAESAKVANVLLNVSEFDSIDEATESLVSMSAAYDELTKTDIIDKLNEVGNNYSIATDGLAVALQKSASALTTAGNDMDEAVALITAGNAVVQDADVVGSGMQTIALRLVGTKEAKEQLSELGEDTDDVISTTSKLRDTILSATKVASNQFEGFDILDANGNYKSTYEIMLGLSEIYNEIAETDKKMGNNNLNLLLETIAGKRRANIAASILQNKDLLTSVYDSSSNDYKGSAQQELNKYLDSIEGKIQQFTNEVQEFWYHLIDSETVKWFVNAGTTIIDILGKMTSHLGGVGSALAVVGTAFSISLTKSGGIFSQGAIESFFSGSKTSKTEDKSILNTINEYNKLSKVSTRRQQAFAKSVSKSNKDLGNYLGKVEAGKATMKGYQTSLVGATIKTAALKVGTIALQAVLSIGLSLAISGLIELFGNLINRSEKLSEEVDELISKYQEQTKELRTNKQTFDELASKYEKLSKGVNSLGENVSLSTDKYKEYTDVVNQIAEMVPSAVKGWDAQGNAILNVSGNVQELIDLYNELIKAENDTVIKDGSKVFKDFKNEIKKAYNGSSAEALGKNGYLILKNWINSNDIEDYSKKTFTMNGSDIIDVDGEKVQQGKIISDIVRAIKEKGIEQLSGESNLQFIKRAIKSNKNTVEMIVKEYEKTVEDATSGVKSLTEAYISNAFLKGGEYENLDFEIQNIVNQMVAGFDAEFYKQFKNAGELYAYIDEMLKGFSEFDDEQKKQLTSMFEIQTQFNNGEITVEEYEEKLKAFLALIEGLPAEQKKSILMLFDIETDEKGENPESKVEKNKKKVKGFFSKKADNKEIEKELGNLTAEELEALAKLTIPKGALTSWKELKNLIKDVNKEQSNADSRLNMISDINDISEGFEELDKIYASIKDKDPFDFKLLDDEKFKETFSGLGDVYADFVEQITSNSDDIYACSEAFNKLVTAWIDITGILDKVTEKNKDLTAAMLEQMGVANADTVVEEAYIRNKEKEEASKYYSNNDKKYDFNKNGIVEKQSTAIKHLGQESGEYNDITEQTIDNLIGQADASGIAQNAYIGLLAQEIMLNNNNLDVSGKLQALSHLSVAAGKAALDIQTLNDVMAGKGNVTKRQFAEQHGIEVVKTDRYYTDKETGKLKNNWKYKVNGQEYETLDEAYANAAAYDLQNIEYTPIEYKGGSTSNKDSADSKEYFDWIETKLKRIQRIITNLGKTVSATWKSWTKRNDALSKQMSEINEEIETQKEGYLYYMAKANSVGLSSEYQELVKNGSIRIDEISDETLKEKIKLFQDWYEKALACEDAVEDLNNELANLAKQNFDNIAKQLEDQMSLVEQEIDMIESYISQTEEKGHVVSKKYYDYMYNLEKKNNDSLKNEYKYLNEALQKAIDSGQIEVGSEAWHEMVTQINNVRKNIIDSDTALIKFMKDMRQLDWDAFDMEQERISQFTGESDFLIDLMSNDKMYNEDGSITDQGQATLGLHALNFNTYMSQADDYANEILEIDKALAEDPYNQDLLERRQELLESQRDSILAAEDEKQAMKDLVEEGYNSFLDSMSDMIDKRKEAMQSIKDLYDYEKNISKLNDEVTLLEKQEIAMRGDTSEEGKAKYQQIQTSLKEARENLEETEYERYLSDQQQMLDNLYDEAEQWVNERLDNIDELIGSVIDGANENSEIIKTTLETEADEVGTKLSEQMSNVWSTEGAASQVVSKYGDDFSSKLTTTNDILTGIKNGVKALLAASDITADMDINSGQETDPSTYTPTTTTPTTPETPPSNNGDNPGSSGFKSIFIPKAFTGDRNKLNVNTSIVDRLKFNDFDSSASARASYYKAMGGSGKYTGSRKQNIWMLEQMKANGFAKGGTIGRLIHRSGEDGFILARTGEEILSLEKISAMKDVFESMNPIVKMLSSMHMYTPYNGMGSNIITNDIEMNIMLEGIHNSDEFIHALKTDRKFEKFVQQITIGNAMGRNTLSKNRYY